MTDCYLRVSSFCDSFEELSKNLAKLIILARKNDPHSNLYLNELNPGRCPHLECCPSPGEKMKKITHSYCYGNQIPYTTLSLKEHLKLDPVQQSHNLSILEVFLAYLFLRLKNGYQGKSLIEWKEKIPRMIYYVNDKGKKIKEIIYQIVIVDNEKISQPVLAQESIPNNSLLRKILNDDGTDFKGVILSNYQMSNIYRQNRIPNEKELGMNINEFEWEFIQKQIDITRPYAENTRRGFIGGKFDNFNTWHWGKDNENNLPYFSSLPNMKPMKVVTICDTITITQKLVETITQKKIEKYRNGLKTILRHHPEYLDQIFPCCSVYQIHQIIPNGGDGSKNAVSLDWSKGSCLDTFIAFPIGIYQIWDEYYSKTEILDIDPLCTHHPHGDDKKKFMKNNTRYIDY